MLFATFPFLPENNELSISNEVSVFQATVLEQTSYCFCSCSKATFSANDTCPLLTGSLLNIYKKDSRLRCKFFSFSSSFLSSSREHDEARQSTNHFLITNRHIKAWCTADIHAESDSQRFERGPFVRKKQNVSPCFNL